MSDRHDMHQEERLDVYARARARGCSHDDAAAEAQKVLDDHDDGGTE